MMRKIAAIIGYALCANVVCTAHAAIIRETAGYEPSSVNILLQDVIVPGDSEKMAVALKHAATKTNIIHIVMDSRGGDVDEAMAMGRMFRAQKLAVHYRSCASSCLYAFLGGAERYASSNDNDKLVVHRPEMGDVYAATHSSQSARMMRMFEEYTIEMLGNSDFYNVMMSVPFSAPRPLTRQELITLRIITKSDNN